MLFRSHFVIQNCDSITVNSEATKKEIVHRFPEYSSKIEIIPMGVNVDLFKKKKTQKPKKYSKNKVLLFVGRLSDQKGLQYLVDSMVDLMRYDKHIKLLVIGEGPYEKILRKRISSKDVGSNVEFLGSISTDKVSEYHNFADIFILPSLSNKTGTEALGLSLLEAMASGCAVVGTNVGGISFAIKNGDNGLLVRQKDHHALSHAIITILKNKKKSLSMGKNAAKFVRENYSWKTISKDFGKIYDRLLK